MTKTYNAQSASHGHGHYRGHNKPKDLIGTWKKLLGYCRKYLAVFMIALICAAAGTVLTLIGPDKLSDMTDAITEGLSPNTAMLTEITDTVSENVAKNMQTMNAEIAANLNSDAPKAITVNGSEISLADQQKTLQLLAAMNQSDSDGMQQVVNELPASVAQALYTDVTIDGTTISGADQRGGHE